MRFCGERGDPDSVGDLCVAQTAGDKAEDLPPAVGELEERRRGFCGVLAGCELGNQTTCNFWV